MKRNLLIATALTGAALGAALVATPALAQAPTPTTAGVSASGVAAAGAENEIIVTARRRTESVQDVPIVVSVLSADEITQRGISNLQDVARYTPGLVFDRGISLQDTRPVIRGLPATRGRPPVGVLLDGIDVSSEALGNAGGGSLLNSRLLDLERIEVVKGPQSALYGRAAFAGAINYITKRPSDKLEAEVRGSYASFDTLELGGAISGPLTEILGFRVNVAHAESRGDYRNPISQDYLNGYVNTGGSVALEVDTGGFNAYLRVSYADYSYDQSAIQAISGFIPGSVSRPGADTPEGMAVAAGRAGGALAPTALASNVPARQTLAFTGVTPLSLDPRTGSDFSGSDGSTFSTTLNVTAELGIFEFVYNGGYVKQDERLVYDGDFFGRPNRVYPDGEAEPMNIFDLVDFDNSLEIINQEVRLQDFSGDRFRWAVGGLWWYSDMSQDSRSIRATSGFPITGTPVSAARTASSLFLASTVNPSPFGRRIDSLSAYGLIEFDITDTLTVTAEGRYITESSRVIRSDFLQASFVAVSPTFVNPVQSASISDSDFVPRFSATYKPGNDLLFYASAAKGFKPAGISELDFASSLQDSKFKAETVWNYEVGGKSSFANGQFTLNAALFYMDWTDKQVSQLIEDPGAPSGFRASVTNAGAAEVYGADISFILRPDFAPGLVFDVGYTYLHTEYTDFTVATNSAFTVTEGANCTIGKVGTGTVYFVSYNGNQLERAPQHQLVSNLNYRAELSTDWALLFGASLQYQSSRFLMENDRIQLPSFVNVDMQVGVEFRNFLVQGFVQNLTNEDAVRSAQNNFDLSTFGRAVNVYAPPQRMFGLRARARF